LRVGEKERGGKGKQDGGRPPFLWRLSGAVERKGGRGSEGRRRVEGKWGRDGGPRARRGIARVTGISPRPAGTGGAIAARQGRATGRERRWHERLIGGIGRHRGPVGSGWVQEGVRGSRAVRHGALTGGPDSTVPAGWVLNLIQTDSTNSKWFKQIQNCPHFG
jgi:hypothetical protein